MEREIERIFATDEENIIKRQKELNFGIKFKKTLPESGN